MKYAVVEYDRHFHQILLVSYDLPSAKELADKNNKAHAPHRWCEVVHMDNDVKIVGGYT